MKWHTEQTLCGWNAVTVVVVVRKLYNKLKRLPIVRYKNELKKHTQKIITGKKWDRLCAHWSCIRLRVRVHAISIFIYLFYFFFCVNLQNLYTFSPLYCFRIEKVRWSYVFYSVTEFTLSCLSLPWTENMMRK